MSNFTSFELNGSMTFTQHDNGNNTEKPSKLYNALERHFLVAFYCIVLLATVAGNSLVCAAVYIDRRLRSHTNWFIVSLAVSDLLYGSVSVPFRIAQQATFQQISVQACGLWIWADLACAAASIANLAVISIDRYIKITKPFSYHLKMTDKRAFIAIGGVWVYAVLLASLSLVRWNENTRIVAKRDGVCLNAGNQVFYTVAMVVGFLTPLVILVVSYCLVFNTALKQFKNMTQHGLVTNMDKKEKQHRVSFFKDFKATKTLAIVIGTFCICWCPFFTLLTTAQYTTIDLDPLGERIVVVTFLLVLPNLNSACNPVVYAYFNSEFRQAFRAVLIKIFVNTTH